MLTIDLRPLFQALQEVLGPDFGDELEALLSISLAPSALPDRAESQFLHFQSWLGQRLLHEGDLSCLRSLGRPTCKKALERLGVPLSGRPDVPALLESLMGHLGLPPLRVAGRDYYIGAFERLAAAAGQSRPEEGRLATEARQLAERVLRETALLFAYTDAAEMLTEVLTRDDGIRLPARGTALPDRAGLSPEWLRELLRDENWGDLGFFALLLRKGSAAILRRSEVAPLSIDTEILKHEEFEAFQRLARALQPYVHFKPSQDDARMDALGARSREQHTGRRPWRPGMSFRGPSSR